VPEFPEHILKSPVNDAFAEQPGIAWAKFEKNKRKAAAKAQLIWLLKGVMVRGFKNKDTTYDGKRVRYPHLKNNPQNMFSAYKKR
jgi:hypothetical protein